MRPRKLIIVISLALVAVACAFGVLAHFHDPRTGTSNEYRIADTFSDDELTALSQKFGSLMDDETAWLETCILPDGAIAFRPIKDGENTVNQYFSIFSAMALMEAAPGDKTASIVKAHLDWSFSHMSSDKPDAEGLLYTIANFTETLEGGNITAEEENPYDAADSELALFLAEINRYVNLTGDTSILDDHADQIKGSVKTLLSLIEDDGLSYGKPSYHVAYLMDNSEVYLGLTETLSLLDDHYLKTGASADDRQLAISIKQTLTKLDAAFETVLWNEDAGNYLAYAGQEGFTWDTFYADATSQLFPAIFGVIGDHSPRAVALYDAFCEHYDWSKLDYYTSGATDFYWSVVALGAATVGDLTRLSTWVDTYESYTAGGHAYPAYSGDAAMAVLACSRAKTLCDDALAG